VATQLAASREGLISMELVSRVIRITSLSVCGACDVGWKDDE
jgi:hypothetical protein